MDRLDGKASIVAGGAVGIGKAFTIDSGWTAQ